MRECVPQRPNGVVVRMSPLVTRKEKHHWGEPIGHCSIDKGQ